MTASTGPAPGQTEVDYAVNTQYGGVGGVQTGSSSKLFTLITALEQGVPFGFQLTVPGRRFDQPAITDCAGDQTSVFNVSNSEGQGTTTDSLYTGTTQSINVFYAHLEQKVGLCNVVKTAVNLGVTRVDGKSLLVGRTVQPAAGRRPARLHARRGERLPDVHGRRVRDPGGERRLLHADRAHQDHR